MIKFIRLLHLSYAVFTTGLYFFFIFFPLVFTSGVIKDKVKRLRIITPLWKILGKVILQISCLTKIDFVDQRKNPEKHPRGLYIANHQSMMDIPLVLGYFVIPPIFKKELLKIPFFGLACKISTAIPVDRKDRHSRYKVVQECQKRLLDGRAVQYYPEGTRSKTGFPKGHEDVKLKLVEYAYNHNIPVTAFSIIGTPKILNKYGFIIPFTKTKFIVAEVFEPKNYGSSEEFCFEAWKKVQDNFKAFA